MSQGPLPPVGTVNSAIVLAGSSLRTMYRADKARPTSSPLTLRVVLLKAPGFPSTMPMSSVDVGQRGGGGRVQVAERRRDVGRERPATVPSVIERGKARERHPASRCSMNWAMSCGVRVSLRGQIERRSSSRCPCCSRSPRRCPRTPGPPKPISSTRAGSPSASRA